MEGTYKLKVPQGKLIIVKIRYSDKIESIQILGDFFVHPEEALSQIENLLVGSMINCSKEDFSMRIGELVKKQGIELIGINPDAIAEAITKAIK